MSIDFTEIENRESEPTPAVITPVDDISPNKTKFEFVGTISDTYYEKLNEIYALESLLQLRHIEKVNRNLPVTEHDDDVEVVMVADQEALNDKKIFIEAFNDTVSLINTKKLSSLLVLATDSTKEVSSLVNLCHESKIPVKYSIRSLGSYQK